MNLSAPFQLFGKIQFPLLCLALGRVNWALVGLLLFFCGVSLERLLFLTYNSISRSLRGVVPFQVPTF